MTSRNAILESALTLFTSRGYDAVGVQEIVEAAGVTKPSLYHFFGSKNGLLETLICEHFTDLSQMLERDAAYHGDLTLTLQKIIKGYFKFALENRLYYRLQLSLWFAPPESEAFKAVAAINEKQQSILEKVFLDAVKDHGNMRGRHKGYAATFLGMINTYITLALNGYTELSDSLIYTILHQFMHGIFS
jgi:AcrR family transcriptional regulator